MQKLQVNELDLTLFILHKRMNGKNVENYVMKE